MIFHGKRFIFLKKILSSPWIFLFQNCSKNDKFHCQRKIFVSFLAMQFRLGELFCGPGGLACGAFSARSDDSLLSVQHAWANDFDADSCATYAKNLCNNDAQNVICADVRDLNIQNLSPIDAFAYGFPCNSFSQVGERQGLANQKFGSLYWYGIKILRFFRPQWFLAENVSGIRSAGNNDFQIILNDMRESGYRIFPHLYKAEQYGIPQTRHRVIIVGIREDLNIEFQIPDFLPFQKKDISAKTAFFNIPPNAPNNEIRILQKQVLKRLSLIEPGENIWQAANRMKDKFPPELMIQTQTKISQIYKKLHPLKPAYTVTAAGGGGTSMYHWENRELTNRERARLQTFPDDFEFVGKYASVRKQIGMAVPCTLSKIIVTAILNSFAGIKYPSIAQNISLKFEGCIL